MDAVSKKEAGKTALPVPPQHTVDPEREGTLRIGNFGRRTKLGLTGLVKH